jgi:hypothetical protein
MNSIFQNQVSDNAGKIIRERLMLIFSIFIIYLFLNLLHIGCPIRFVTGLSCPGCGMTRAVLSALHLNFEEAFYYHPLFLLSPVMVFLYLFEVYLNPKLYKIIWFIIIALFLFTFFVRLFITKSPVVEIDISTSVVLELLQNSIVGGNK